MLRARDGDLTVYPHKVTISQRGVMSKLSKGSVGNKDIDLRAITAVQLKRPGLGAGFIQLSIGGETAKRGGIFEALRDENALVLQGPAQYQQAVLAKQYIEHYRYAAPPPGPHPAASPPPLASSPDWADQIRRLKQLEEEGLLTPAQFEEKKAEILSRL